MKLSFDREWWNTQQITKSCCTYKRFQPWNAEWQRQHGQTRHSLRDGAGKSSLSPRCSQLGWEMLLKALINPSQPATSPRFALHLLMDRFCPTADQTLLNTLLNAVRDMRAFIPLVSEQGEQKILLFWDGQDQTDPSQNFWFSSAKAETQPRAVPGCCHMS